VLYILAAIVGVAMLVGLAVVSKAFAYRRQELDEHY